MVPEQTITFRVKILNMISSKTSFIALIGNPVSHSLSPIMQNAALQYLGLDLIYIAVPCKDEDLELVLNSFKKINCKGLNITIPHKEKVFNLCSEISPIANKLKAINTLKLNSEKKWSATNTDVEGFIYPLKNLNLAKKQSIVLGSGGAARSVIQGLINLNLSTISVISRNKSSLDQLIKNFENQIQLQGLLNSDDQAQILIREADLIVNTTPAGMKTIQYENNVLPYGEAFWTSLNSQTIVYDLIYNPAPTSLLKFSAKKGCMTIDGLEMLVAQGIKSLSFWTDGLEVPFHVMNDALKKYL
uniref:Shikimate dehydrogenase (NADP(+)) n=1 Tax=uncultured Prochlorococcus marinus clone HOT0M-8F9 TaxID=379395 RepID=Q1PJ89_PROMR|nr:shikimate / quinate 5-dehydrogenase [uncultured Prochlorococcus marinus clone HOT0M-8F9]